MFSRIPFRKVFQTSTHYGRQAVKLSTARTVNTLRHFPVRSAVLLASAVFLASCALPSAEAAAAIDYSKVKQDILTAIEQEDSRRNDGTSIAPTLIRLAWHASGTFSVFDLTGGSNGATMRFAPESEWGANRGLKVARDFLEKIKQKHRHISYADLWTLAGGN